jgi:hypothetical protein
MKWLLEALEIYSFMRRRIDSQASGVDNKHEKTSREDTYMSSDCKVFLQQFDVASMSYRVMNLLLCVIWFQDMA